MKKLIQLKDKLYKILYDPKLDFIFQRESKRKKRKRIVKVYSISDQQTYILCLTSRDYSLIPCLKTNPYILSPIDVFPRIEFNGTFYEYGLLFEYCSYNLREFIKREFIKNKHQKTEDIEETIVSNILNGIKMLHSVWLCHGDIKPDNILLCKGKWKISDLEHTFTFPYIMDKGGTPGYKTIGPSIKFYDAKEEIFATLATIYFLISGKEFLYNTDRKLIENFWNHHHTNISSAQEKEHIVSILHLREEILKIILNQKHENLAELKFTVSYHLFTVIKLFLDFLKEEKYTEALISNNNKHSYKILKSLLEEASSLFI